MFLYGQVFVASSKVNFNLIFVINLFSVVIN